VAPETDRARPRCLLHPGRDVDGVAHGGELDPEIGPDLIDHDQTGVDPDPHVERQPALPLHTHPVLPDRRDDVQAGEHRALRVVFVRDGRPEEGQDAVPQQLRHRALVAVHRGHEVLDGALHHVRPLLGVEVPRHGGRAFDVAKEHGDDATLTRHAAARLRGVEPGLELPWDVLAQIDPAATGGGVAGPSVAGR
jgi:hypothetical protein